MAPLGGVKNETETREYLERNLNHWDAHGFGLWILRERAGGPVIGRALLRHLDVEGRDEIARDLPAGPDDDGTRHGLQ